MAAVFSLAHSGRTWRTSKLIALALLAGALFAGCSSNSAEPSDSPTIVRAGTSAVTPGDAPDGSTAPPGAIQQGSRVEWRGEEWYLLGVNLPWYNWACDFGCNANGGASSRDVRAALEPRFAELQAAGIHNVRWWLFPGDPWQIDRDVSDVPQSINPAVYADLDAALAMAESYDLYFTFTFFSAPSHLPGAWLQDEGQRDRLVGVLGDLVEKYAGHQRILAWDVINEPEFDIWEGRADAEDLQSLVGGVADEVHERGGGSLVTVGSAMLDGLPFWVGLGLDFYSPHWYDYMDGGDWCARCTTYEAIREKYSLDAPVVIGELYAGPDSDSAARFAEFYEKGYAGAWAWSLIPERTEDRLTVDFDAAAGFAQSIEDDGPGTR